MNFLQTKLSLLGCLTIAAISNCIAQKPNWQGLDLKKDSVFGISTEKTYLELLPNKEWKEVIVAVIDMGIDTAHEDLKPVLWTNLKEIPGNGIDDDRNGYIDDIHGWNFSEIPGGKQDITLLAMRNKEFFDSLSYFPLPAVYRAGYQANRRAIRENNAERTKVSRLMMNLTLNASLLDRLINQIGKNNPSPADFKNYAPKDSAEKMICSQVLAFLPYYRDFPEYKRKNVDEPTAVLKYQLEHAMNMDDTTGEQLQGCGNNDITGPFLLLPESSSYHGTSVASILAADRNNNIGISGVADHVKIMSLRVVPFFEEIRNEYLAKAIRYAVDNGAKIINLSFGNSFSFQKKLVDQAVQYAMDSDVLIVKSAGNDGSNTDIELQYPSRFYQDSSGAADAWITVAASGAKDDSTLVPAFSNYGKTTVDVFAPGNHLISAYPGSKYGDATGTSVAAPVVAGLAALIREYYPTLTAVQVKDIIMKSVVKRDILKDKCVSGGVVNAYNALQVAATYK